ncbi:glucocorticoid-induced transcript 1 protein-like isoform X2 [Uloborus diversus]|uniref:glucocorticoid-induced transcript 1 protein-like isoform X2 n=1 Tax=Uloborus diversus TaxID=327109 RepID=UPI002409670D|nr:glucocorticoid-induced transcript 1 protein-like isoform X2 [Uloborus diversus]
MSGQQSQRMRKNVSPGAATKQGPIRATVPLSLMHQTCSPTRCLKNSPSNSPPVSWSNDGTKVKRLSPDNRISPETQSPSPSGYRADKSKALTKAVSSAPFIRRTASVDTIYLLGQWQRDTLYLSYCGRLMMDRATQTPEEFEETDRRLSQKKSSAASGETLEMKYIRQRLQRTNRLTGAPSSHQRQSPVQGDHSAISSSSAAGATSPTILPSISSPHHPATFSSAGGRALPIPIPDIPKPLIPRMRSSVEGLNQEIERIVLREISHADGNDNTRTLEPTPEGHRAPIADLFRNTQSVDTQTPFDRGDSCHSSNSSNSGSHSVSPVVPIIPGQMDNSRPSSTESKDSTSPDLEGSSKLATSPHINKFLAREPPDGCEKVKIAEETRNSIGAGKPKEYSCPKPSMNFVLLPSQSSAFYPLCKNCVLSAPNGDIVNPETPSATSKRLQ